jgi:hypothetical protein
MSSFNENSNKNQLRIREWNVVDVFVIPLSYSA